MGLITDPQALVESEEDGGDQGSIFTYLFLMDRNQHSRPSSLFFSAIHILALLSVVKQVFFQKLNLHLSTNPCFPSRNS